MANFDISFKITDQCEGGYCKVTGDPGGETINGIARNFHPDWLGWKIVDRSKPLKYNQRIKSIDFINSVEQFYRKQYWDKLYGDSITSQRIANILYDWNVNAGKHATNNLIQIINAESFNVDAIEIMNKLDEQETFEKIKASRIKFYNNIAKNKPSESKFLAGWIKRANSFN